MSWWLPYLRCSTARCQVALGDMSSRSSTPYPWPGHIRQAAAAYRPYQLMLSLLLFLCLCFVFLREIITHRSQLLKNNVSRNPLPTPPSCFCFLFFLFTSIVFHSYPCRWGIQYNMYWADWWLRLKWGHGHAFLICIQCKQEIVCVFFLYFLLFTYIRTIWFNIQLQCCHDSFFSVKIVPIVQKMLSICKQLKAGCYCTSRKPLLTDCI